MSDHSGKGLKKQADEQLKLESIEAKAMEELKHPSEADLSYVDDLNAALLLKTPRYTQHLLYLIVAFVLSAILWASLAELDEVTTGIGKVIPSKQLQIVQNLEGGIVKEIFVREGEAVEPGQPLLLIDDTRFRSDLRENLQELANLQGSIARHKAALASVKVHSSDQIQDWQQSVQIETAPLPLDDAFKEDFPSVVQREQAALEERLNNLGSQLSIVERQVAQKEQEQNELGSKISYLQASSALAEEELAITIPLAESGVVSRVELIGLEREVNDIKGELASLQLLVPKVDFELQELISKRWELASKFRAETQDQLNELEGQWSQISESEISLQDRVDRTTVQSPVKGTVQKVNVTTVGGVIQPGMDIIEIVPVEDKLLVETKILPQDIAFLRPGLEAVVKFTAYDFAIYGGLKGKLEHISADTIQDEEGDSFYLVRILTDQNHLGEGIHQLPIIPGMVAEVDLVTGKKTVLNYLLKPILRAKETALRER